MVRKPIATKSAETEVLQKSAETNFHKLNNREEQIEETRHKPQWIVSQGHSHTYNSRMQLSRLQRIYQAHRLAYD